MFLLSLKKVPVATRGDPQPLRRLSGCGVMDEPVCLWAACRRVFGGARGSGGEGEATLSLPSPTVLFALRRKPGKNSAGSHRGAGRLAAHPCGPGRPPHAHVTPDKTALGMCVLSSQPRFREDLVSLTHEFTGNIIRILSQR